MADRASKQSFSEKFHLPDAILEMLLRPKQNLFLKLSSTGKSLNYVL